MDLHEFDCFHYKAFNAMSESDSFYMNEIGCSSVEKYLYPKYKIEFQNSYIVPFIKCSLKIDNAIENKYIYLLAYMYLDISTDDNPCDIIIAYLCAEKNQKEGTLDTFWVCEQSNNHPYGRIYEPQASANLYSALFLIKNDFKKWIKPFMMEYAELGELRFIL